MNKEIKIITLGDIFKNIETEEKAFNFLNYIKELQQENQQLKKQKDDVVEYIKNNINYYYDEDLEESIYQDEISGNEVLRMLGETDVED